MGINYNPKVALRGLVMALDARNRKSYPGSGVAWTNLNPSRSDLVAILTSSPTYNANGYFTFNGSTQYIKRLLTTPSYGNSSYISYNVWFRQTSTSAGVFRPVFHIEENYWVLSVTSNVLTFSTAQGGGAGYDFTTGYAVPFDGTWVNASISHTFGGPVYIYINGELIYTTTNNVDVPTGGNSLYEIGAISSTNDYFHSDIALVSYYDVALTAQEISQNFNALRGRFNV